MTRVRSQRHRKKKKKYIYTHTQYPSPLWADSPSLKYAPVKNPDASD